MNTAIIINNSVAISEFGDLPNGVGYINLPYDGTYDDFLNAPNALHFKNRSYGKSGHNSDTFKITYRTDKPVAMKVFRHDKS